jgi:uncharacterized protein (TIGR02001 family)
VLAARRGTRCLRHDGARRSAFALSLWLCGAAAHAQFSGSASLLSDYRYRGVSLSDNEPAAQLTVVYDDASGWYAGAFASTIRFGATSSRGVQSIVFAGYAWRASEGWSYEVGITHSRSHVSGSPSYSYSEIYAGFAAGGLSGRLYYAPSYFGDRSDIVYAELNGAHAFNDRIRLVAHVGALVGDGTANVYGYYYQRPDFVVDGRIGVVFDLEHFELQLSGVAVSSNGAYPTVGEARRRGVVLQVSRAF